MDLVVFVSLAVMMLSIVTAKDSPEELCATVNKINCYDNYVSEPNEVVCASNGETYLNRCFFVQAKCQDKDIKTVCHGNCTVCANNTGVETTFDTSVTTAFTPTRNKNKLLGVLRQASTQRSNSNETGLLRGERLVTNEIKKSTPGSKTSPTKISNSFLTTADLAMISMLEERIHNITGRNITRTRKHLPGHHVDVQMKTTVKQNTFNLSDDINNTAISVDCLGGSCSGQKNFSDSKNCSSSNCIDKMSTGRIKGSTLLKQIVQTTSQTSIQTISPTKRNHINTLPSTTKGSQATKVTTDTSEVVTASTNKGPNTPNSQSTTMSTLLSSLKPTRDKEVSQLPAEVDFLLFCTDVDKKICPETLDPLCGTDNKFYLNICTFDKAKCKDKGLQLQADLSSCRERRS